MSNLVITVQLLTGRYVAAHVSDRDAAEWPPHPGRLFMALAATCFERGSEPHEVAAAEWLEKLPPPEIFCGIPQERSRTTVYVATNDKLTPNKAVLQATPGLTRSKQARSFPTVLPSDELIRFLWRLSDEQVAQCPLENLNALCRDIIRVGHSSSLVNVSANLVSDTSSLPSHNRSLDDRRMNPQGEHWRTTTDFRGVSLRVPTEGEFARLRFSGSREKIDAFVEWQERCTVGTTSEKRSAKRSFEEQFGIKFSKNMRPPEPIPATISTWQTYCRANEAVSDAVDSEPPTNCFDTDLVVLTHFDGPTLTLADTLSISKILRSSVMTHCGVQPPPPWVSGHDANSKPTKDPHLAFLPLAYTGSAYADGHLLGYALALPIGIPLNELRECLAPVLYSGESPSRLKLTLGILGEMTLLLEQRLEPPQALRVETWTLPSRRWESVTPVVLDRYPKTDRRKDLLGWRTEVAETICRSCEFVGVPRPTAIDIDTTAFQQGVPRATQKQVPGTSRRTRRGAGDGFRPLPTRQGKPARPQIHVRLQFESPVAGPILIGAGRFLGYGLLKPVIHHKRDGGS